MAGFSKRFWYRIRFGTATSDCLDCSLQPSLVDDILCFRCSDEKVEIPVTGFEDFDIDKAKEVMDTLRDILDVDGIQWTDMSTGSKEFDGTPFVILRTHITYHGRLYSVILGTGTYGFENYKLELMSEVVNGGEPVGYLTVTDVISILKNGYNPEVWYG